MRFPLILAFQNEAPIDKADSSPPFSLQEIAGDVNDKSPGLKTVHELILEDDSWEKVNLRRVNS